MNPTPRTPRIENNSIALRSPIDRATSRHRLPPSDHVSIPRKVPGRRRPWHEEESEGDEKDRSRDDEDDAAVAVDLVGKRFLAAAWALHPGVGVGRSSRERGGELGGGRRAVADLAVVRRRGFQRSLLEGIQLI